MSWPRYSERRPKRAHCSLVQWEVGLFSRKLMSFFLLQSIFWSPFPSTHLGKHSRMPIWICQKEKISVSFPIIVGVIYGCNWWLSIFSSATYRKRLPLSSIMALANEDTFLRPHCCPWCFSGCANWETFVAGTKCFWTKSEIFLYPGHKICVRIKCCARGQTFVSATMCPQQCILVCQGL